MSIGPQELFISPSADYALGKRFRAFYDFTSIAAPIVLKFTISKNIDLTLAVQEVHDGDLRYRVFTGGTEGGTFTDIPIYPMNAKSDAPTPASNIAISTGGTLDITGLNPIDVTYVRTANSNGAAATVSESQSSMRGFPATVAYVVIDQIPASNKAPSGVLRYEWTNS